MTWVITVPRPLPSQNRAPHNFSIAASHKYRKQRVAWVADITRLALAQGIPLVSAEHQPMRRVLITRLWGKGQREIDKANVWGGIKLILDALCPPRTFRRRLTKGGPLLDVHRPGASLIVDDAPKWCDVDVGQEKATDGTAATRIAITDMEAA